MKLVARTPHTITDPELMLDTLAKVRRQGWALINQELELGLMSLGAPVKDRRGKIVAAINVSVQAHQATVTQLKQHHLPQLLAAAERISALLPR